MKISLLTIIEFFAFIAVFLAVGPKVAMRNTDYGEKDDAHLLEIRK